MCLTCLYNFDIFIFRVPMVQRNTSTPIAISLQVENVDPSMNITRGDFLLALSDVQMVLIPASYYDRAHDSG